MRAVVGRDDADVVHGFVEQRDGLLVLDDLHGIEAARLIERARDAGEMTPRLRIFVPAPQAILSFGFGFRCVLIPRRRRRAAGAAARLRGAAAAGSSRR
jgi:hypothetical protein